MNMPEGDFIEMEMGETLDGAIRCACEEAKQRISQTDGFVPFTVLASGDEVTVETHPGEDVTECVSSARQAIMSAEDSVEAYVYCYDGYVEYDDSKEDAAILECAERGDEEAAVLGLTYSYEDNGFEFSEELDYLGATEGLLAG